MRDIIVIMLIILISVFLAAIPMIAKGQEWTKGKLELSENCVEVGYVHNTYTAYCENPENGKHFYTNNYGMFMKDEE